LKALRASAEVAVLAKDVKQNVDHNRLGQPILAKGQAFTILEGQEWHLEFG
jgi:hypothetical protein